MPALRRRQFLPPGTMDKGEEMMFVFGHLALLGGCASAVTGKGAGETGSASDDAPIDCEGETVAREGEVLEQRATIAAERAACTSAVHAGAGSAGSVLRVTVETWDGVSGATLGATDLLGEPLAAAVPVVAGDSRLVTLARSGEFLVQLSPADPDERANGYALSLSCEEGCDLEFTRYPILLMHGMGGTDSYLGLLDYFYGVADELESRGYAVETPAVDPFSPVEDRSAQWVEHIQDLVEEGAGRRFLLIGHSQGGLDARYVASALDEESRVAAVVTIGTPHLGTPVADAITGAVDVSPFEGEVLDEAANAAAAFYGVGEQELTAQLESLSSDAMAAFNEEVPDRADVYYASWTGHTCAASDWECQSDWEGEVVSPLLAPVHRLISMEWGASDGLVTIESGQWGDFQGEVPADHLDEIGQLADSADDRVFDHVQFYVDEAQRLGERGL